MVLELCDRGSLTNAVLSGKFFRLGTQEPQLDLPTVLLCLADIAQASHVALPPLVAAATAPLPPPMHSRAVAAALYLCPMTLSKRLHRAGAGHGVPAQLRHPAQRPEG